MTIAIGGGGPAGLTAAYELTRHGLAPTVFESLPLVGGIARTEEYKGYRFDLGGHRFFSKSEEINALWPELLGAPLMRRERLSRIYYRNKFFRYPLKPLNAFMQLGPFTSLAAVASYFWSKVAPIRPEVSFEDWVSNRFGRRLYQTFFKTYTEKVWGIPCTELSADWAAQRIQGLSLSTALFKALIPKRGGAVKTLIEEFKYPPLGPGQLWEAAAGNIEAAGGAVRRRTKVNRLFLEGKRVAGISVEGPEGTEQLPVEWFLSTLPIRELILMMEPAPAAEVVKAAKALRYRDFLTVALIVDRPNLFPDNWIYIHSPEVQVGRLQNFGNWSPHLAPDPAKSCIGLEYFLWDTDELYQWPREKLIELGASEVAKLGLLKEDWVEDGHVVPVPKAYPVYDDAYQARLGVLRGFLDSVENLYCIGRNGQHRYNNMDHSMMTALLAARNIAEGKNYDPWAVNTDAEYHEEQK